MPSFSSRIVDEEATRAAARALYGSGERVIHVNLRSTVPLADLIAEGQPVRPVQLSVAPSIPARPRQALLPPLLPQEPSSPTDTAHIEALLRSAPQVCATCQLLSNEPARPCPSPRGHYFVTDYPAMAQKVRTLIR
jgi:hypothetical protein